MRLPWLVQNVINKLGLASKYTIAKLKPTSSSGDVSIQFICGFHGQAGGPEAIASVANMLAERYRVSFQLGATSHFNRWLSGRIKRGSRVDVNADLYICDRAVDEEILKKISQTGKPIIVTIHGQPFSGHALSADNAFNVFKYAQHCHFVSQFQADQYAEYKMNSKDFVISNPCADFFQDDWRIEQWAASVGMVGYFTRKDKNVVGNLAAATGSAAKEILVWGDCNAVSDDQRVKLKGFSSDQRNIFNSFDVFISLSRDETFGLSVAQALSAGKECVLSNIPAHVAFAEFPGIAIVDVDDHDAAAKAIDAALKRKTENRQAIHAFWSQRYASRVVAGQWYDAVEAILRA